jgi:sugar lactone lactonase YvrE
MREEASGMAEVNRVGDFALQWGESLRWDERRARLYFVDCATHVLSWLDGAAPPLHTLQLPSLPTGVVLTEGDELVVCLDEGLHVVDPETGTNRLLAAYPEGMGGRANDANADGSGNLITGTLNVTPGPGSLWWFSARGGWRLLDDDFGNVNGPVVVSFAGESTLVVGDTVAEVVYAYRYDAAVGAVADRRVLSDHALLGGAPDGATVDAAGGIWSCVLRSGRLARLTGAGVDRVLDVPMANPSDLAFGDSNLSRLFVTSIAFDLGEGAEPAEEAGWLIAFDDLGVRGRPEARFDLAAETGS